MTVSNALSTTQNPSLTTEQTTTEESPEEDPPANEDGDPIEDPEAETTTGLKSGLRWLRNSL